MVTEFLYAGLIFTAPVALHFRALLGFGRLGGIRTPFSKFDDFYNRRPYALSFLAGGFFAAAYLLREQLLLFDAMLAAGLVALVADLVGMSVSFYLWVSYAKRRNRKR